MSHWGEMQSKWVEESPSFGRNRWNANTAHSCKTIRARHKRSQYSQSCKTWERGESSWVKEGR